MVHNDGPVVTYRKDATGAQRVRIISDENVHGAAPRLFLQGHVKHGVVDLPDLVYGYQHLFDVVGKFESRLLE